MEASVPPGRARRGPPATEWGNGVPREWLAGVLGRSPI